VLGAKISHSSQRTIGFMAFFVVPERVLGFREKQEVGGKPEGFRLITGRAGSGGGGASRG